MVASAVSAALFHDPVTAIPLPPLSVTVNEADVASFQNAVDSSCPEDAIRHRTFAVGTAEAPLGGPPASIDTDPVVVTRGDILGTVSDAVPYPNPYDVVLVEVTRVADWVYARIEWPPEVFGTLRVSLATLGSEDGVIAFSTYPAPSMEYRTWAGAVVPVPAAVIVHDTGAEGTVSSQDPSVYGDGQLITGAGGGATAVRNAVHGDQVPFHSPRSSFTATRA
jgi:hypothetical protein